MSNVMSQAEVGGQQGPPPGSNPTTQMASGSPKLSSVKYKTILPIGKTSGYKENEKIEYNINPDIGYFDGKQSYWNIVVRNTSTWDSGHASAVQVIFNPNQGGHAIKNRVQLQDMKGLSLEDTENANLYTGILNAYGNDSDVFSSLARVEGITGRSNQNQHTSIANVDNQYFLPNAGAAGLTGESANTQVGGNVSVATTFCLPFNLGLFSAFSGEHMAYPNLDIGGTRLTLYLEQARRCMTSLSSEFYREKSAGGNAYNGIVNVNHRLETTAGAMDGQSKFLVAVADCNTSLVINGDAYNVGKVAFRAGDQVVLSGGAGADHTGTVQEVKINKGAAYNQVEITLSAASGATDFTAIQWAPYTVSYELDKVELKLLETVPDAGTINSIRRAMSNGINYNTYQLNKLSSAEQLVNAVLNIPTAITRGLSIMVVPVQISASAGGATYGINGQDYRNSYMNPVIDSNFYGDNNYKYQWQIKNILIPNRQVELNSTIENANDNSIYYLQQTMALRPMKTVKALGEGNEEGRTNPDKELLLPFFFPILLAPMGSSYNLLDSDPNLRIENTGSGTNIHAKLYHIFINHTRKLTVNDQGTEVSL